MAETEQFEENDAKAKAIKNPLMLTLREHPQVGRPADRPHAALHALLLHVLLGADPVRGQEHGLDDGMVFWALSIATALFVVLQYPFGWTADHFGRKPQMLVWSGAIALLMVPISTLIAPEASFGSVLLVFCFGLGLYAISRSIAPAIMSELFPTELRGPGHRRLVQPHRRPLRRHRSAGHPVARRHRPQQLVLLVRLGRRRRRVRRDPDPPGDQGVGAQVSRATDLLASRVLSMSALGH